MDERLIETSPGFAHFVLENRMRLSVRPNEIRSVVDSPKGIEVSLTNFPPDIFFLVSGSYEDVLSEINRASM